MSSNKQDVLEFVDELKKFIESRNDVKACIGIVINEKGRAVPNIVGGFSLEEIADAILAFIGKTSTNCKIHPSVIIDLLYFKIAELEQEANQLILDKNNNKPKDTN